MSPPTSSRRRPIRVAALCAAAALLTAAPAAGAVGDDVGRALPTLRCEAGGADVPFEVSPGAAAVRVWARAAHQDGRPGAWAEVATVPPSAGGVRFVPDRPGRYELCVRALDAAGSPVPPGPLTAGLAVVRRSAVVPAAQLTDRPAATREPSVRPTVLPAPAPLAAPRAATAAPADDPGGDPLRARVLLGAARNAVALRRFDEAVGRFEEYLAERPEDLTVRAELAGVLAAAGRPEEAAAAFATLLAADPENAAALAGLADLLIGLGQYASAREHLLTLLAVTDPARVGYGGPLPAADPRFRDGPESLRWRAAVKLARTYLLENRPREAAGAVDAHLSGGPPEDPEARREFARLLIELGRPAAARPLLDGLRRTFPDDPAPVADLLLANARLLDPVGTAAAANDLAARPVTDPALWLGLAEALYRDDALREARRVLGQLLAAHPDHAPAAVLMARVQSRLLDLAPARQALDALAPTLAGEVRYESAFAEHRVIAGEWADAVAAARDRLRRAPADPAARRDLAEAYHASGQFLRADAEYARLAVLLPEDSEPVLLRAKNRTFRRDFGEALTLLNGARARDPGDVRALLATADVLVRRGTGPDLLRAQSELLSAPPAPRPPRAEAAVRTKLAEVLIDRRRPSEALRELDRLPPPAAVEPLAVYLRFKANTLLGRKDAARAALGGGGSPLSPLAGDPYTLLTVAGLALEDCECCLAGELANRVLKMDPVHPLAGLLRAEAAMQCRPSGGLIPNCGTGSCCDGGCGDGCGAGACGKGGGVCCAILGGCFEPATTVGCGEPLCGGACGRCPGPGSVPVCEADFDDGGCGPGKGPGKGCGSGCGSGGCGGGAAGDFGFVLSNHPANSRARLGLARSLWAKFDYYHADEQYGLYLADLPGDLNAGRERARVADAWRGHSAASPQYAALAKQFDADGAVAAALTAPGDLFAGPGSDPFGIPGGAVVPALDAEYEALGTAAAIVSTERFAKSLRTHRPRAAGPILRGLIELEPGNQDARFDLAQTLGYRGYTRAAEREYLDLLALNPCHTEARVALERHRLWRRPAAFTEYSHLELDGRDGLADIRRDDYTVGGRLVFGDAGESLTAKYTHTVFEPPRRPGERERIHGEIGSLRFARRIRGDLSGWAQLNVEEYDDEAFDTRPTFDAGIAWVTPHEATVRAFGFLENIALNRESLRQDIHRGGVQTDFLWLPTRRWQLDGFYRFSSYSDDNAAHEGGLHNGFILRPGRRQVRLRADADFAAFREFTIPGPPDGFGRNVRGSVHPYFSPDYFAFGTLGLEWKHWLSCDTFLGANAVWYELYAAARFDSDSESYGLLTARLNWDVTNQLTLTADTGIIRGEIFDETRARAYAEWRFR